MGLESTIEHETESMGARGGRDMVSQSRTYGSAAEQYLREERDLEVDQTTWHDARTQSGEPVEIKAAKREMSNGRPGRFLLRRESHERLQRADGWIGWVVYRARGRGIEVLETRMQRARAVRVDRWTTTGGAEPHRDAEKQIPVSEVFG